MSCQSKTPDPCEPQQLPSTVALRQHRYSMRGRLLPILLPAAFRLAATTGMRRSELLGLKWSDVDWAKGTVPSGYEPTRERRKPGRHHDELRGYGRTRADSMAWNLAWVSASSA